MCKIKLCARGKDKEASWVTELLSERHQALSLSC